MTQSQVKHTTGQEQDNNTNKGDTMINEEILRQLKELEEALEVVNIWQDKEEGKALKDKTINEFIRIKTVNYRNTLTSKVNKGDK